MLFLDGGLRLSEVAGLQVADVDLRDRIVYVAGKASRRSGPRHRAVPLGVKAAAVIAQALGANWFWSFAPALVGDDFRPLAGPDPGGPAYGNLLVSRLPLAAVEHLRVPPAGGGEQRTAILGSIQVGSRSVTVAATHLSNRQGHNVRQLRELQQVAASPGGAAAAGGRPEHALHGAAGGLPTGLARDRPRPHLPQFRPHPAAGPHLAQRPGRGGPTPTGQGGRRARQRSSRPGGRAGHRSALTSGQPPDP